MHRIVGAQRGIGRVGVVDEVVVGGGERETHCQRAGVAAEVCAGRHR
jgi:hypothetical protein